MNELQPQNFAPSPRRWPSFRFGAVLCLLALAWGGLTYALNQPTANPLFGAAGLVMFRSTASLLLLLIAAIAVMTKAGAKTQQRMFCALECVIVASYIILMIAVDIDPLWDGIRTSGDNLLHYTLAALTEQNLWNHGSLRGWSSALGMGFPLNDLYPPGGNLLVIGLHILTLGLASLERVYSTTVFLGYLGFALLMYKAARMHFGRLAGAALLALLFLDRGDWYFSWPSALDGGLWAMQLGLGLCVNAFALFVSPRFPKSRWQAFEFIICITASILLHPFYVFLNGLWLIVFVWALWAGRGWRDPSRIANPLQRMAFFCLGYGMAAFWWLPFALSRDWIFSYGYWGRFMPEPGRLMLEAAFFREAAPYLSLFGLAALAWGFASRKLWIVCFSVFILLNLFLGTEPARYLFSFHAYSDFFIHMQTERLFAVAKIGCLLLMACMVAALWKQLIVSAHIQRLWRGLSEWIWPSMHQTGWKNYATKAFTDAGVVVGLFLVLMPACLFTGNLAQATLFWEVRPSLKRIYSIPGDGFWQPFEEFKTHLAEQAPYQPGALLDGPFPPGRALTHIAWRMPSIAAKSPISLFVTGYLPANVLGTRPLYADEWTLDLAGVNYFIEDKDAPDPAINQKPNMQPWYENEKLKVYKRTPGIAHPWILSGSGTVERLPDEDGALRFRFDETNETSFFRLGISGYRKWQGTLNSGPIDLLLPARWGEPEEAWKFIGFPASDGVFELRYQAQWFDTAALAFSGVCFVLTALLLLVAPLYRTLVSIPALSHKFANVIHHTASGVLFIAALAPIGLMLQPGAQPFAQSLRFMGNYVDHVGTLGDHPDGKTDMIFMLKFTQEPGQPAIKSLNLIGLDETGAEKPDMRFSTKHPHQMTIGVLDMLGQRCEQDDGALKLPPSRNQRLLLFVHNIYEGPIPMPLRMKCVLDYADGSSREFVLQ
ncbi:MAG: hypothetical protein P9L94_18790 [Candidatus Hinthialibacter antarcticus]|nr:hypothetical protein [Candidatus Hinthialibacter antarcticus]